MSILFALHFFALATALVGIMCAERLGFAWFRGKVTIVDDRRARFWHSVVTLGLAGLLFTGPLLFWPMRGYLIHEPLFLLKFMCVVCLVINAFVIDRLLPLATTQSFAALGARRKWFIVSGAISLIGWIGAISCALLLFGAWW